MPCDALSASAMPCDDLSAFLAFCGDLHTLANSWSAAPVSLRVAAGTPVDD